MCSDLFGPVRIRSDAFRYVWVPSDALGRFRKISKFFETNTRFKFKIIAAAILSFAWKTDFGSQLLGG